MRRFLMIIAMVFVMLALTAGLAGASTEGAELRRIDTSNVNRPEDIKAVAEEDDGHDEAVEVEAGAGEDHEAEKGEGAAAAETEGEHGEEEEAHHPAWMIPGWQSIFTVLAVIYFGLGVTLLPYIMAKEEH